MSKRSQLARLTGWPMITTKYRAHWRVMIHTHPLILKLLEDNADGDTRRASLSGWRRAVQGPRCLCRVAAWEADRLRFLIGGNAKGFALSFPKAE